MTVLELTKLERVFGERMEEAKYLVSKTNKSSILIIQQFPTDLDKVTLYPRVRESISNILAFVELGDIEVLKYVVEKSDGFFDYIVMDSDLKCSFSEPLISYAKRNVKKSKYFSYSDNSTWADSAVEFIQNIEGDISGKNVLVAGEGLLTNKLLLRLYERDSNINWLANHTQKNFPQFLKSFFHDKVSGALNIVLEDSDLSDINFVIGSSVKKESISSVAASKLNKSIRLYDIGIGNFSSSVIKIVEKKNCRVFRLDNRAGISSMVVGLLETDYLVNKMMGKVVLKDIELVSGGIMGHSGAIIVDNVNSPSYIIGIADGEGRVKFTPENEKELRDYNRIQKMISKI